MAQQPQQRQTGQENVAPLNIPPGIDRDSSVLASKAWTDGQWCRWFGGRWMKMGGLDGLCEVPTSSTIRQIGLLWANVTQYVGIGEQDVFEQATFGFSGGVAGYDDRTPAGFIADPDNNWQIAYTFDAGSGAVVILAHCTTNLSDPGSGAELPIYYGDATAAGALLTTTKSVDGGVVALPPYTVGYGSGGYVAWSDANQPTVWGSGDAGEANITATKIIRGLPVRGGGNNISGLLWSQDSLIKMQYIGGTAIFAFQTISAQITVLSTSAIVEYEGRYYWPGVDHFFIYDGTVRTLPNDMNVNYFFNNLNFDQRQKVFAVINPRFGEIWFHFPFGDSEVCNHAVVFSVAETARTGTAVWYDTPTSDVGPFVAGAAPNDFKNPVWATSNRLWKMESGTDITTPASPFGAAIEAFAETNYMTATDAGVNNWTEIQKVEPDFQTQAEDITVTVTGLEFPRSTPVTSTFTMGDDTVTNSVLKNFRLQKWKFDSNARGGNFVSGKLLLHPKLSSGR